MGARVSDELLEFIEKASPLPVKNNTCTGIRRIGKVPDIDNLEEIMIWYAGELLSQPHCMRMMDISSRRLLLNDPNITGIIYNTINFCDFYGFEYAEIKEILRVPIIKIETDYTLQSSAQLKNRLEAFFETLRISAPKDKEPSIKRGNSNEFYTAGIDSGSTSTNAVIIDSNKNVISFSVIPTGVNVTESANRAFENVLQKAGLSKEQISHIVATGYGRTNTGLGKKDVTEITCHAKGAFFLNPNVRTVIDIGGQDSKVIRIDSKGSVKDFAMNDKCAAGTGRFLDMMAQSLELTIEEISKCGLEWSEEINISSMCSVFAQSEVVSLIAAGKKIEDIVHGIYISVAAKVISLSGRTGMDKEFMMTGGVAKNIGVVKAIEEKLGRNVHVEKEPEICGALGAALIAWEEWNSKL
jgi:predicted CoA-substrate-specific enzyme activase